MKTKIKNKFTATLLAIAMLFVSVFAIGGVKTKTAKADSGTTYNGNDIESIAPNFAVSALNDFCPSAGSVILIDSQLAQVSTFLPAFYSALIDILNLSDPGNDSARRQAVGEAGVTVYTEGTDESTFSAISNGTQNVQEAFPDMSYGSGGILEAVDGRYVHMCAMGIWQLGSNAYGTFDDLQVHWWEDYGVLMPIYVIEREEVVPGEGGLILWVYDDAHGGGFWGTWEGRPEE